MEQRTDDEVMGQRESTMLAIKQLTAEVDANEQKRAWYAMFNLWLACVIFAALVMLQVPRGERPRVEKICV